MAEKHCRLYKKTSWMLHINLHITRMFTTNSFFLQERSLMPSFQWSVHLRISPTLRPKLVTPLFFAKPPLKSASCPSRPFLAISPIYYFSWISSKNWIFGWTPMLNFFILTPFHLLKKTKNCARYFLPHQKLEIAFYIIEKALSVLQIFKF